MSAAASLGDTYSGGPIFDDFLANLTEFVDWMAFVMLTLRASIVCGLFV